MAISKKLILHLIILIWIVFSVIYIFCDLWSDFKITKLNQAYQQGRIDTISELIRQTQKCEPFSVFSGETQVNLINTDCLKVPESE